MSSTAEHPDHAGASGAIDAVIVGCGLIGEKRAVALQRCGVTVRAVHDVDDARARALANRLATVAVPTLAEALALGPALVVVATDHASLATCAAAAAAAGCNVLVEKPGARTAAELQAVADAAAERGVVVRVGYNHRFHPSFLRMVELSAGQAFGPLLHVRARYGHGGRVGYEKEWRADRARSGGGELIDQAVHLVDLCRFVTGDDVALAFAELRTDFWAMDVEDNAYLALRPQRGGFAWLHASWTEWKNLFSFEVAWREAKLEVTGLGGSYGMERLAYYRMLPEMGPPDTTVWEFPRPDTSWEAEVRDVLAELRGEPSVGADIRDGLAVLRIVDEANA